MGEAMRSRLSMSNPLLLEMVRTGKSEPLHAIVIDEAIFLARALNAEGYGAVLGELLDEAAGAFNRCRHAIKELGHFSC